MNLKLKSPKEEISSPVFSALARTVVLLWIILVFSLHAEGLCQDVGPVNNSNGSVDDYDTDHNRVQHGSFGPRSSSSFSAGFCEGFRFSAVSGGT